MGDDYSEIFARGSFEFAFFRFKREAILLENFHDLADNLSMLFQGFSEYEDVIQIYHYYSFRNQILENSVHHHLEGSRTIGQTEEHDKLFVEASVSSES